MPTKQITIYGYLVGPIWWPINTECSKPLEYDATEEDSRSTEPLSLREHVLRATNDGDFQFCKIADGFLEVSVSRQSKTGIFKHSRTFPLSLFPSIADLLKKNWEDPTLFTE